MRRLLLLIWLVLLTTSSASARTWYVKPDSTGDAPTIPVAMDSAAYGDTVLVGPGTYESGDIPSWDHYEERNSAAVRSGPEETILRSAAGTAIRCDSIVDAEIVGFTISESPGHCCYPDGIMIRASRVHVVRNVIIGFYYGIDIYGETPYPEQPFIHWNTIWSCLVGIHVYEVLTQDSPRLQGNGILDCFAAGVEVWDSSPMMISNTIQGGPGGISFYGPSDSKLTKNRIIDYEYGGVWVSSDSPEHLPRLNPFGSKQDANDIHGNGYCVEFNDGTGTGLLVARYNYWGTSCPNPAMFSANVDWTPWVDSTHATVCHDCETCQSATTPTTWGAIKSIYR